jgi:dienelactone hydrolase
MPRCGVVERVELRLPDDPVHGTFVRDAASGGDVAVVVIAGSGGGDAISVALAHALAREGIPSLGLGYFKVPGRPDDLADIDLEYLIGAVDVVRSRLSPDDAVVLLGSSRGSEAAQLLAIHRPGLVQGVVALVPADAAFGSWPPGGTAWTLDGAPVAPGELPVERIDVPMLLVSAGSDEIWPSSAMAGAIAERRGAHGQPTIHLDYPDATHALSFVAPAPGAGPADAAARSDAWPRVLDFVRGIGR